MPQSAKKHTPFKTKRNPNTASRRYSHLYDRRWQKARLVFLSENPFCVYHQKQNKIVQANIVDHIIPHKGDLKLFWDRSNWQPLCKSCHDRKTARKDSRFAKTDKPDKACDVKGIPIDPSHHWNN